MSAALDLTPSLMAEAERAEAARLEALEELDILDTPSEEAFDRLSRLTMKVFRVPMATVTLVDAHRQWFKASAGLDAAETPRDVAFCDITIRGDAPLVIEDTLADPRFEKHPLVVDGPKLRFYAGVPLRTRDGHAIGTLCAMDTRPHEVSASDLDILNDLARLALDELELRQVATTDGLTGASSRRAFKEQAGRAIALAQRYQQELSCIALDIDHFKLVNDTHGHAAGDRVLTEVVRVCRQQLRQSDLLGRLGGEEFAVLLPHTGLSAAMEVAEKLRAAVTTIEIPPRRIRVTSSFGVAALSPIVRDLDTLLSRADSALYQAKKTGRNRCIAASLTASAPTELRRRVLKGGIIFFNNRRSTLDCTVRTLSETGAGIDVYRSFGLPREFDLAIPSDSFDRPCRVTSQTEKRLEVEFV